jgi:hypothetical protein
LSATTHDPHPVPAAVQAFTPATSVRSLSRTAEQIVPFVTL